MRLKESKRDSRSSYGRRQARKRAPLIDLTASQTSEESGESSGVRVQPNQQPRHPRAMSWEEEEGSMDPSLEQTLELRIDNQALVTDSERLAQTRLLLAEHRLPEAARLVAQIKRMQLLRKEHYDLLQEAHDFEVAVGDLGGPPDGSWTRQGEIHARYDTAVHYKVDDESDLCCRMDTPIEVSLLVPLLSVIYEVELYKTWIPSVFGPGINIESANRLEEAGFTDQTFQLLVDVPWPFSTRDAVFRVHAIDDIQSRGQIAIRMTTVPASWSIPDPQAHVTRVDFDCSFVFRACPSNHPLLRKKKKKRKEPMVLVSIKVAGDLKMDGIPKKVMNFATRAQIGEMWRGLLSVAATVRAGRRDEHEQIIERRADTYNYFRGKIDKMIAPIIEKHRQKKDSARRRP